MTEQPEPEPFTQRINQFLDQSDPPELFRFAGTCTSVLQNLLEEGFDSVNEGFNPDEGTKPIVLIRERLLPVFSSQLQSPVTFDNLDLQEPKIVFDLFKSQHPVDLAIKALQEKLLLIGNEDSMKVYIEFTNTLETALHGGVSAKDPLFVKAQQPAEVLYVIFAGMVCFPEFKKSIESFGDVDQLHILDPHRSWYMQGPEGEWNGYEHYCSILKTEIEKRKANTPYKKICFLGNSMGGSAACLYSGFADAVLAFCPQTDIVRKEIPEEVSTTYKQLLKTNLEQSVAAGTDITVHRGVSESDIAQCNRLPDCIQPVVHEGCTVHNLPGYLKDQGILLDVLGSMRSFEPAPHPPRPTTPDTRPTTHDTRPNI
jgi:hypothetical protein